MKTRNVLQSAVLAATLFTLANGWTRAAVTMQLDRGEIHQDEAAQLTVNASGADGESVSAPSVAGLEFTPVNQSTQVEIINGVTTSSSSVTYEVSAAAPGTYTIPAQGASGKGLTLRVVAGPGGGVSHSSSNLPAPVVNGMPQVQGQDAPEMSANGAAFVHLEMPKRQLYVGETVPVKIQMGFRAGVQPSLNGLPTPTADAFTLNKLTDKPAQAQQMINGVPYVILTWNSALAAIKPGDFPLAITSPVTIQMRAAAQPDDDDNSPFGGAFFQNFFGRTVQKNLNLTSAPVAIKVLPLPTQGQPANFSGAVGQFELGSTISSATGATGDPLTLKMQIKGNGGFDRVKVPTLGDVSGWKTYPSTSKFVPADSVGYSGEKDFEQAIIPLNPGHQNAPSASFSYFNPESGRYETANAPALTVDIAPGTATVAGTSSPAATVTTATTPVTPTDGLQPDRAETGRALNTLEPLYFQPGFLIGQGCLILGFVGAGVWLRRREKLIMNQESVQRRHELKAVDGFLDQMEAAAGRRDAVTFFLSARQALQHCLAWRWKMAPGAVTVAEIDAHLPGDAEDVRQVFHLADQLAYAGHESFETDFTAWKQAVHQLVKQAETL